MKKEKSDTERNQKVISKKIKKEKLNVEYVTEK